MNENRSSLLWIVLVGMIGCTILVYIYYHDGAWQRWEWLKAVLFMFAFGLIAVSLVWLGQYIGDYYNSWRTAYRATTAINDNYLIARELNRMTPETRQLIREAHLQIRVIPGSPEAAFSITCSDGIEVSLAFAAGMIIDGDHLRPVNQFSDGSWEHKFADAFTERAIRDGFASEARGNHSAKWINGESKDLAVQYYGLRRLGYL